MAGLLLVISGPSGAGKSTVLKAVMSKREDMFFSVSATTRPPRPGEMEGEDYFFVTPQEFNKMQREGHLLEVGIFADKFYGTPYFPVMKRLERGETVVLDIETDGASQVKRRYPEAVLVFLTPSNEEEAERRLRNRATEDEQTILERITESRREYTHIDDYNYIVVNDNLEDAIKTLESVIIAESARTGRNKNLFNKYRED
jgi:guanylate kinase